MIKYIIKSKEIHNEILLAFVSDSAFESFELIDNGLYAYLKNEEDISVMDQFLNKLQSQHSFYFKKEEIPYQNWNAIWESNFQPVMVDDFCIIRADFHETQKGFEHEIIINPKMAFGTGHHETSFMMLQLMRKMNFYNKNVFDYGAGTGILSIMASYKGAKSVLAIDIEEESYLNTIENADRNNIDNIESRQNVLADVKPLQQFDIILANINRKVLLDSAKNLISYCKKPATLLLSGILRVDIELVQRSYQNAGFDFKEMMFKGEWVAMKFHYGATDDEIGTIGKSLI